MANTAMNYRPQGPAAGTARGSSGQPGRVELPAGIDQASVSRASTRIHVGNRPREALRTWGTLGKAPASVLWSTLAPRLFFHLLATDRDRVSRFEAERNLPPRRVYFP